MANSKFELIDGIKVGNTVHKDVEIAELTLGEMYEAEKESEFLQIVGGKAVMVSSPSDMGIATIRRQIKKLGDLKMPISDDEVKLLSMSDINLIRQHISFLDQISYQKVIERGRASGVSQGS